MVVLALVAVYSLTEIVRLLNSAANVQAVRQSLSTMAGLPADAGRMISLIEGLTEDARPATVGPYESMIANFQQSSAHRLLDQVFASAAAGSFALSRTLELIDRRRRDDAAQIRSLCGTALPGHPLLERKLANWILDLDTRNVAGPFLVPATKAGLPLSGGTAELVATTTSVALIYSPAAKKAGAGLAGDREPNAIAMEIGQRGASGCERLLREASGRVAILSRHLLAQLADQHGQPGRHRTSANEPAAAGTSYGNTIVRSAAKIAPVIFTAPEIRDVITDFRADFEVA